MAQTIPKNSVWSAMTYTPPRGRCNHKTSLMSPACPCLRFMLHPVKAATSFECDGCAHHASFHSMENPEEDAVVKRWQEQQQQQQQQQAIAGAPVRKRKRIADKPEGLPGVFEVLGDEDEVEEVSVGRAARGRVITPESESSATNATGTRARRGKKAGG